MLKKQMDKVIRDLVARLDELADRREVFDMVDLMQNFAFDTIGQVTVPTPPSAPLRSWLTAPTGAVVGVYHHWHALVSVPTCSGGWHPGNTPAWRMFIDFQTAFSGTQTNLVLAPVLDMLATVY